MPELAETAPHGEHFATAQQQRGADRLGMWLFLATEVMMFGGLFMGLIVYRITDSEAMRVASRHLDMLLGGINTAVLLTSSATIAQAVLAARGGQTRQAARWLTATAALGTAFLAIKAWEYLQEYREGLMPHIGPSFPLEPAAQLFFNLYFASTGLHALHLTIGVALVGGLALQIAGGKLALPEKRMTVECFGLYWHFVDIVWVFLYPALYLAGR